ILKVTTPSGEDILEEEECKEILKNLSNYITEQGGKFHKEDSIVVLRGRKLRRYNLTRAPRIISIPRSYLKEGKINPYSHYDIIIFNEKKDFNHYNNSHPLKNS
ncbi:MAG: hypothetical protein ACTSYF_14820, partial [Promethearchaeota archaeon]